MVDTWAPLPVLVAERARTTRSELLELARNKAEVLFAATLAGA